MHAEILIRVNSTALTHDEAAKWPVAVTDLELAAPRIVELIQGANSDLGSTAHASATSLSWRRATTMARMIAGTPIAAA